MTRCRISNLCERFQLDIGSCDLKSKRTNPRSVNQKFINLYLHQKHFCVIWKKNRNDSLLNGREKIEKNFK